MQAYALTCFLKKKILYNKDSPLITSKRKNKQFCQTTNPAQRVSLHQKLKKYRNQMVTLN